MRSYPQKLHLGCGGITPEGWLNLDGSWNSWLAKYPAIRKFLGTMHICPESLSRISRNSNIFIHDLRKPFPFQDNYFKAIYASHLLEHLYLEEAKQLLAECHRVLERGGVLRMVVPDLKAIVMDYINEVPSDDLPSSEGFHNKADILVKRLYFRFPSQPSGSIIYRLYTFWKDFHTHKWMYDSDSLMDYFRLAGFVEVNEMKVYQSKIEKIEEVENPDMILKGRGICVEGMKP